MSARINLLPHRAESRKRARVHFFFVAGLTAVFGAVIVLAVHTFYAEKIDRAARRDHRPHGALDAAHHKRRRNDRPRHGDGA